VAECFAAFLAKTPHQVSFIAKPHNGLKVRSFDMFAGLFCSASVFQGFVLAVGALYQDDFIVGVTIDVQFRPV
jgi:hypothetical protein